MIDRATIERPQVAIMNAVHDLPVLVARDQTAKWNMVVPGATYENTVDNRAWE